MSGGLSFGTGDSELLTDESVEEGGLAGVWFTGDGDDAGARHDGRIV